MNIATEKSHGQDMAGTRSFHDDDNPAGIDVYK
jgi:hypothetical protein